MKLLKNSTWHSIKTGLKNLYRWLPVIWQDRQWDYNSIYVVLHKKLEIMEEFYYTDQCWGADHLKTAKEIKMAKLLLKRLIKGDYLNNALIPVERKYGEANYSLEPCRDNPKHIRLVCDETEEHAKARKRAHTHSDDMEKQDLDYLFKYLRKNIKNWWD